MCEVRNYLVTLQYPNKEREKKLGIFTITNLDYLKLDKVFNIVIIWIIKEWKLDDFQLPVE